MSCLDINQNIDIVLAGCAVRSVNISSRELWYFRSGELAKHSPYYWPVPALTITQSGFKHRNSCKMMKLRSK